MRRSGFLAIALVVLLALPALAGTMLVLSDGQQIELDKDPVFDGREFTLPDGRAFPREQVNEVRFESVEQTGSWTWQYDPARYEKLFAKGRELAERYPNRPGIILEDIGVYRREDDGTNSYEYHFVGLVLKEKAQHWATVVAGGDTSRDIVEGPFGVVVHPDGTYRRTTADDITRTNPYSGTVFFNRYFLQRVQIPEVQVGDIIEYWYRTNNTKPIHPDFFFPGWYFQSSSPMALSRVTIRVPHDRPLYFEEKNFPETERPPLTIDKDPSGDTYTWELVDSPPFDDDPYSPHSGELMPGIRATLMKTWDPIYDHLSEFYRSRMIVTDRVRQTTAEVVGDATDVEEKISRIYTFVQRKIRYISIKTDFGTGYTGHPAEVTLANGYGDCTDKSILLATMLKVIGVKAHPIFLHTWGGRRDIYALPNLGGTHSINRVWLDDRVFFLDATANTYRYPHFRWDDHGMPFGDPLGREVGFIDQPPADDSVIKEHWILTFAPDGGAQGQRILTQTGVFEAMSRSYLESIDPQQLQNQLRKQVLAWGAGGELINYRVENLDDLNQTLRSTLDFKLPQLARQSGGLWVIEMPDVLTHFSRIDLEERKSDLVYPLRFVIHAEYEVTLPNGWRLVDWPKKLEIKTDLVDFAGEYQPTDDGFVMVYELSHHNDNCVTPEQYPAYRQTMVEVETFFARRAFAEGDAS